MPKMSLELRGQLAIKEILTDVFFMEGGRDFIIQSSINHSPVDFLLVNEAIGINVSAAQPHNEIKTRHIHNAMVITFSCLDIDLMRELVVTELKRINVSVRANHQQEQTEDEW